MIPQIDYNTSIKIHYKSGKVNTLKVTDFYKELNKSKQSDFIASINSIIFINNETLNDLFYKVFNNLTTEQFVYFFDHLNKYILNNNSKDLAAAIAVLTFYYYKTDLDYKDIIKDVYFSWSETTRKIIELLGGDIENDFINYFIRLINNKNKFYDFLYYFTEGKEYHILELYKYDYRNGIAIIHIVP